MGINMEEGALTGHFDSVEYTPPHQYQRMVFSSMINKDGQKVFYCISCQRERPWERSVKKGHFRKCRDCIDKAELARKARADSS